MRIIKSEYVTSAVGPDSMPQELPLEVMFLGRSNVGKSSFINALTNRKMLARTGKTPGKTQTLNFYIINNEFYLIDAPGYGYQQKGKGRTQEFGKMIESVLKTRENLKMVFLLVDYRRATDDDKLMYDFLKHYNVPVTIIVTKADKLKNSERKPFKDAIIKKLELNPLDKMVITSSEKKEGVNEVLDILESLTPKLEEIES